MALYPAYPRGIHGYELSLVEQSIHTGKDGRKAGGFGGRHLGEWTCGTSASEHGFRRNDQRSAHSHARVGGDAGRLRELPEAYPRGARPPEGSGRRKGGGGTGLPGGWRELEEWHLGWTLGTALCHDAIGGGVRPTIGSGGGAETAGGKGRGKVHCRETTAGRQTEEGRGEMEGAGGMAPMMWTLSLGRRV